MSKFKLSILSAALISCLSTAHATEEVLPKHLQDIEALQHRVDKLASGEPGADNYFVAKARTWLDLALAEYHQTDTTGLVTAATTQAQTLIESIENKVSNISMDTPNNLVGTEVVRTDLWDKIAAMKGQDKFSCGQSKIAEAEVYLVWTGHEKMESGWTHAESYARSAENLIYEAQVGVTNCVNDAARLAAATPPQALTAVVAEPKNVEKLSLSGDATFIFGTNKLTTGATAKLDKLAEGIKSWSSIQGVDLIGHTDRLRTDGNESKNQELSEKRAEVIKQYLVGKGIPTGKITASGAGSSKPIVECSKKDSKAKQVVCLQPNRRVEIILRGEK